MRFDLKTPIYDAVTQKMLIMSGTKLANGDMTLLTVLSQVLLASAPNERASAEEKAKRYLLLTKLLAANEKGGIVDLTIDELSTVTALVDALCPTIVHGRVKYLLNNPLSDQSLAPPV